MCCFAVAQLVYFEEPSVFENRQKLFSAISSGGPEIWVAIQLRSIALYNSTSVKTCLGPNVKV